MAVLSLPLTFNNSFWSHDYRKGLEVLYQKLEQGVAENEEIIDFIRARSAAEAQLASTLLHPLPTKKGVGFDADDGASLLMAFRGLQAESVAQGQAHHTVANELTTLVADPFDLWAQGYKDRLRQNKVTIIDNWLRSYEQAQGDVAKLKHHYLTKTRRADEAEDDAKFAPSGNAPDNYTRSPRLRPIDSRSPQRTASVSERITQRLKEIQKKGSGVLAGTTSAEDSGTSSQHEAEKSFPKLDKGKGKEHATIPEVDSPDAMSPLTPFKEVERTSPMPLPPPSPVLLAGLSLPPVAVSQLLARAAAELPLRPVRFPLLGEYQDAFTGEELVNWLKDNVDGFGGSLDRAEDAARDLTERDNLLRRLGELGNDFEASDDAFYQFRPKAFNLNAQSDQQTNKPDIVKRTGALVNLVSKALNANGPGEPAYVRARHDADEADRTYRVAVRKLDRQRLLLEEKIEETLKLLQRWESERLRAVKTVLLQYQGTLANLPKVVDPSIERQATLIAAYQPELDLTALIERYRTGPFRPDPQVYESVAHDESDVVFGIDLRKWAEGGWFALTSGQEKKDVVPPVVTALLTGLDAAYTKLESGNEKRKTWIYDVPLPAVHHLRESLNAIPPDQPIPAELLDKYDAPVLASTVKLWILELDPPLALYEGWDDFRRLYPLVGSSASNADNKITDEQRLQNVATALQKLPRVHLYVLDAIVKHLRILIANTKDEESDEVFITKLALSLGRTIVRPKHETELSIQDRHPTLLFIDLLEHYDTILPPTIAKKKRESERKVPIRKRTAPIDMRLSRSRISLGADAKQLLAAQQAAQNPSLAKGLKSPPLPPPLPSSSQQQSALVPPPPPPPEVVEKLKSPSVLKEVDTSSLPATPPLPRPKAPLEPSVLHQNSTSDLPPRPQFKEPPPELDDLPPRPNFKEPPPELDGLPPRPQFADPPPENGSESPEGPATIPNTNSPTISPSTNIIPPTPQKRMSTNVSSPAASKLSSRSPSPPTNEDVVLGPGKSTIARHGSGQSATGGASSIVRGPRLARGPRPQSGNVQNLVSSINRNSMSGASPSPASPKAINRLPTSGSPVRRPSSVVGRSAASFSRRTMASDAEDDVVDKK